MTTAAGNKHAHRSAQTRDRFIEAAQQLFAQRSIDSVSLNEITVAAGQKNRNALQYHFGGRDGLLQAIVDRHADRVHELREAYLDATAADAIPPARAASRGLVYPLARYIGENDGGVEYVKILSQLAALNNHVLNPETQSALSFRAEARLARTWSAAVAHLDSAEAQRRMFLCVSITFHGLADACRACEAPDTNSALRQREALFEQVAVALEGLLAAPPAH